MNKHDLLYNLCLPGQIIDHHSTLEHEEIFLTVNYPILINLLTLNTSFSNKSSRNA